MQVLREWNALKEWAVVVKALEDGKQCLLFRKGGILDNGFSVESSEFLLFPTFEHQTKEYLKDGYKQRFDELLATRQDGKVTITSAAKVVASKETGDREKLHGLRDYHVYNDNFVDYRMSWNKTSPTNILLVRAYKLKEPVTLDILPEYAGCRSWVRMNAKADLTEPALGDKEFNDLRREIEALVA